MSADPVQVWRCTACDVTWTATTMQHCWSCGQRPTYVKPWRPQLTIGSATMHCTGDLTKHEAGPEHSPPGT